MMNNILFGLRRTIVCYVFLRDWDSEVRFTLVDPDGNQLYDSGILFAGLNYQSYVTILTMTCFISSIYESGNDCDDNNAALNGFDEDGDGVSSCAGDAMIKMQL